MSSPGIRRTARALRAPAAALAGAALLAAALSAVARTGVPAPVPEPEVTLHRAARPPGPPAPDRVGAALGGLPSGVRTGMLAVDVMTGEVLHAVDADAPFVPASVTKLVTAAAVLVDRGGPGGFWSAELTVPAGQVGRADVSGVTLRGSGDPTLEVQAGPYSLRALAVQAHARGLRRVTRVAVADGTVAPDAWADTPLGVPMTGLRLAAWQGAPPATAAEARQRLGAAVVAELRRAGVRVDRDDVASAPPEALPAGSGRRPEQGVASVRSASPAVVLAATLRPSDNLRAEELLATLARRPGAPGRRADAHARVRAALRRLHVDQSGVDLHDGSGLDRRNRVSARAVVGALRTLYAVPFEVRSTPAAAGGPATAYRARRNAFVEALPRAGTGENVPRHDGPGGTLALRLRGSGLDVRAKTGTLPGVSALAGYVTARSGRDVAFAVLMNGPQDAPILTLRAVQDDVVRALAAAH